MAGGYAVTYLKAGCFRPVGGELQMGLRRGDGGAGEGGAGDGEEACGRRRCRCWLRRCPEQPTTALIAFEKSTSWSRVRPSAAGRPREAAAAESCPPAHAIMPTELSHLIKVSTSPKCSRFTGIVSLPLFGFCSNSASTST